MHTPSRQVHENSSKTNETPNAVVEPNPQQIDVRYVKIMQNLTGVGAHNNILIINAQLLVTDDIECLDIIAVILLKIYNKAVKYPDGISIS